MLPLKYIDDPRTTCIMFRRTTPQLKGQGGLFDTAFSMYNKLPEQIRPRFRHQAMEAIFPNGAKVKWNHMESVKSKYDHQGLQYTFIGFDEGTQFEWEQIEYLISRMRSESTYPSRMVISCNPDPDHYLRTMIDWYIDEDGYPIQERDGAIRWFLQISGTYVWGNSKEELITKYQTVDFTPKPISFSFISALIYDNPLMIENNPSYLAFLEGLNEIDKARLLKGNWDARAQGSNYFERGWLKKADKRPMESRKARAWDKASTEPSGAYVSPDYSACAGIERTKDGEFFIYGDYHPRVKDEDTNTHGRFRKRSGERNMLMLDQAKLDGTDTTIVIPQDAGGDGVTVFQDLARFFLDEGFKIQKDTMPNTTGKLTKFEPFSTACSNGLVHIVESSFDPVTLEAIYKELESFDGTRSTATRKDDWADAFACAFNFLLKVKTHTVMRIPEVHAPSIKKQYEL